jgi:hypothetical protein
MSNKTAFGKWLAKQPRGTLSRLSEQTGLSKGHLHDLANKECRMMSDTAAKLAPVTGIPLLTLLGLEPPEKRKARV